MYFVFLVPGILRFGRRPKSVSNFFMKWLVPVGRARVRVSPDLLLMRFLQPLCYLNCPWIAACTAVPALPIYTPAMFNNLRIYKCLYAEITSL
jgi:hypothetical protein